MSCAHADISSGISYMTCELPQCGVRYLEWHCWSVPKNSSVAVRVSTPQFTTSLHAGHHGTTYHLQSGDRMEGERAVGSDRRDHRTAGAWRSASQNHRNCSLPHGCIHALRSRSRGAFPMRARAWGSRNSGVRGRGSDRCCSRRPCDTLLPGILWYAFHPTISLRLFQWRRISWALVPEDALCSTWLTFVEQCPVLTHRHCLAFEPWFQTQDQQSFPAILAPYELLHCALHECSYSMNHSCARQDSWGSTASTSVHGIYLERYTVGEIKERWSARTSVVWPLQTGAESSNGPVIHTCQA